MDISIVGLFTLPFLVFCIVIYLITQVFRKLVEFLAKRVSVVSHFVLVLLNKIPYIKNKFDVKHVDTWFFNRWRENILPAAPLLIGGILSYFIKDYPYPESFGASDTARTFLGVVAGLVCTWLYPRVMFYLKKLGVQKVDETAEQVTKND